MEGKCKVRTRSDRGRYEEDECMYFLLEIRICGKSNPRAEGSIIVRGRGAAEMRLLFLCGRKKRNLTVEVPVFLFP